MDDEPSIVEINEQMLERLGYRAVTSTSSTYALDLFRKAPAEFDLVITDMTMPHLSGDRLTAEIMKIRPGMPVILCTGYSDRISGEKAHLLGIREFIMKPVNIGDLARAMRKVLDEEGSSPRRK